MKKNTSWFTLIELLITMSILMILTLMVYANYAMSQNIIKVKLGQKEIAQSISLAKNMAMNGYEKDEKNQSIAVVFDTENGNQILYYTYDFDQKDLKLDPSFLLKTQNLQDQVYIEDLSGQKKVMIYFSSIYAEPSIYTFWTSWEKMQFNGENLDVSVSYKHLENFPFLRKLTYYKGTNVVDY